ncbi:hypothetical protein F5Y15DRAFT_262908 [Xylariaceae sp. FL0016]|nr:hypothetical protein F5Y15DRAFT_262908 [Xylariaceae sp. FL0016]
MTVGEVEQESTHCINRDAMNRKAMQIHIHQRTNLIRHKPYRIACVIGYFLCIMKTAKTSLHLDASHIRPRHPMIMRPPFTTAESANSNPPYPHPHSPAPSTAAALRPVPSHSRRHAPPPSDSRARLQVQQPRVEGCRAGHIEHEAAGARPPAARPHGQRRGQERVVPGRRLEVVKVHATVAIQPRKRCVEIHDELLNALLQERVAERGRAGLGGNMHGDLARPVEGFSSLDGMAIGSIRQVGSIRFAAVLDPA